MAHGVLVIAVTEDLIYGCRGRKQREIVFSLAWAINFIFFTYPGIIFPCMRLRLLLLQASSSGLTPQSRGEERVGRVKHNGGAEQGLQDTERMPCSQQDL